MLIIQCVNVYTCNYAISVDRYVCVHVRMCVCVRVYIYIYICMFICIYVCIHIQYTVYIYIL